MVHSYLEGATAYVGFDALKESIANYFLALGAADNVPIIAAAVYVNALGGGEVTLEVGTYDLSAKIAQVGNITFNGLNKSACILLVNDNGIDGIEPFTNQTIRNLTISTTTFDGVPLVILTGRNNITIDNCIIIGEEADEAAHGSAIYMDASYNIRIIDCLITGGAHNGILSAELNYNVWIIRCTFDNNYDDAMDPNADYQWWIIDCIFTNSHGNLVSLESACYRFWIIGCKADGNRIGVHGASYEIYIAACIFQGATDIVTGIYITSASFNVTITNCQIYDAQNCILVNGSSNVIITGCILRVYAYQRQCLQIVDATYVYAIGNFLRCNENIHWVPIDETGSSDYNVYVFNLIYNSAVTNKTRARFIGANSMIEHNYGNTYFMDYGGVMTGVADRDFTYDDQQGLVEDIDTSGVAKVSAAINFPSEYPSVATPKVPKVILTLLGVDAGVTIDTVECVSITATGFTYSINVTAAVGASTCDLQWRAHIDRLIT